MSEEGSAERRSTAFSCTLRKGGVRYTRGPPPEGAVWDPVWDPIWDPLWDPIWDPMWDPIWDPHLGPAPFGSGKLEKTEKP